MRKEKCTDCSGSGFKSSLGGIKKWCDICKGKLFVYKSIEEPKIDKRSTAYKNALKKLESVGLSKEEAEKELDKD